MNNVQTRRKVFRLTKDNIEIAMKLLWKAMFHRVIGENGLIGNPYYFDLNSYYGNDSPMVQCQYFNYKKAFPIKIYIGDMKDCILIELSIRTHDNKPDNSTVNIPLGSVIDIDKDRIVTYTEGTCGIKYVFHNQIFDTRFRIFTRLNDFVPMDIFLESHGKREREMDRKKVVAVDRTPPKKKPIKKKKINTKKKS